MFNVLFMPDMVTAEAEKGTLLTETAAKAGVLLDVSCNGLGICGKCKVRILSGDTEPLTEREISLLSEDEINGGYRLACQLRTISDMEISVPSIHGGSARKKKMVAIPEGFISSTDIHRSFVRVRKAKMDYQLNDLDRIRETLGMPEMTVSSGLVRVIHQALDVHRGNVTVTLRGSELIGVEAGDTAACAYGAAFDIGTTTVVGMLWDLNSGDLIDVETRTNYQSLYGADVISRIAFTMSDEGNLGLIHEKVIQCCNDILGEMCSRTGISSNHIFDVTAAGNTTMSHLFAGVTPKSMSRTPFAPVFCEAQDIRASELGIAVYPYANVHILPNIAGHVGSDITAMVIASGIDSMDGSHIAIDIGTNGEVVAVHDGRLLCCSTAAGPAFEGATIKQGMRAAPGAIEKVYEDSGDIAVRTIEDSEPAGICGSGLIDAIA
ncbi:MAG: DUF4445 domain-containing protein, partial [Mogibacterium sp.]|nr:DUF4445 domain-containing protein [Mogibacterium sp.]